MAADGPRLEAVVIGAGQGGLATSYLLRQLGIDHVVLERSAVAASWRERRWDSFCTVTPNWSIALPGAEYAGGDPDGFLTRDELVGHFERWAESFAAPLRCGVEVRAVRPDGDGFAVETDAGVWRAENVVVATGTYQAPHIPPVADRLPGRVKQITADDYKRPDMLAPGGVMVVGAGQTGCQIAEELHEAGRDVWLCVGRAGRLPRRWRGRDCIAWQRDMGYLDRTPAMLESPRLRFRADPHLTGRTLSLHDFHRRGIRLLGRLVGCSGERARFDGGLHGEMRFADEFCERITAEFDRHIEKHGIDAPPPTAEERAGGPPEDGAMPEIRRELDLAGAGIANVVWATGYRYDFSWIEAPVLDGAGYPVAPGGVSAWPGLYFTGLNWMTWRKSGILWGVGDDARSVARHLAANRRRSIPAPG